MQIYHTPTPPDTTAYTRNPQSQFMWLCHKWKFATPSSASQHLRHPPPLRDPRPQHYYVILVPRLLKLATSSPTPLV
ncbi:BZ3500_MvSof-1268-A1-R1_Chr2-3g05266 [Microbotryum saponariae]|uniref:BZ3500_MvSof-1268-A1-R1_Chr2-3g05266 protein n=1 Tax=Microbotryum saponariae TaxID=289078 RepID=A0A2X0K951_9BASI|nr:BZ3500_MvSof-1268-A1-R1_Chr2-3g05266 [Microbotryum saponariae]SDA01092.1 BZ3501_MvSof-1269-A2-R1_Chr2-2g04939 [Microbotryum saponariae]